MPLNARMFAITNHIRIRKTQFLYICQIFSINSYAKIEQFHCRCRIVDETAKILLVSNSVD